ncbi:MAG TPA: intradiol ring-cleavage dioxygenase [Kribbellaceae bacterium]
MTATLGQAADIGAPPHRPLWKTGSQPAPRILAARVQARRTPSSYTMERRTTMAPHEHDRGLTYDLGTLLARRRVLGLFAGAGLAALAGCADDTTGTASTGTSSSPSAGTMTSTTGTTSTTGGATEEIPQETSGPYPGDGSNGPNVLTQSGIVRSDIRRSFGSASGVADGVPLTVELTVTENTTGAALPGAAVYLWHCDARGRYSLYSEGLANENYLRGVQAADANGTVTFTTIFPAAYSGRWPHIHFEVYASLSEATAAGTISATSQLALPQDVCAAVYATDGYDGSARNLASTSLKTDNVFGDDGGVRQLATVTGSVAEGYVARLTVPV